MEARASVSYGQILSLLFLRNGYSNKGFVKIYKPKKKFKKKVLVEIRNFSAKYKILVCEVIKRFIFIIYVRLVSFVCLQNSIGKTSEKLFATVKQLIDDCKYLWIALNFILM